MLKMVLGIAFRIILESFETESQNCKEFRKAAISGRRNAIFNIIIAMADELIRQILFAIIFFITYTMNTMYTGTVIILSIVSI